MEEAIYIITHIIMAGCCIMIVVVGMNFKEANSLIIEESDKFELEEIAITSNETEASLQKSITKQELQLTTN